MEKYNGIIYAFSNNDTEKETTVYLFYFYDTTLSYYKSIEANSRIGIMNNAVILGEKLEKHSDNTMCATHSGIDNLITNNYGFVTLDTISPKKIIKMANKINKGKNSLHIVKVKKAKVNFNKGTVKKKKTISGLKFDKTNLLNDIVKDSKDIMSYLNKEYDRHNDMIQYLLNKDVPKELNKRLSDFRNLSFGESNFLSMQRRSHLDVASNRYDKEITELGMKKEILYGKERMISRLIDECKDKLKNG